jgi:hypothetical protein
MASTTDSEMSIAMTRQPCPANCAQSGSPILPAPTTATVPTVPGSPAHGETSPAVNYGRMRAMVLDGSYETDALKADHTDPAKFSDVRDEVLGQIRQGNTKPRGYFFFPPPLRPSYAEATNAVLGTSNTEARYVDQWMLFGHYDPRVVDQVIQQMLPTLTWPKDKQDIGELIYMLYQIGRTQPYDRSLFSLQLKILDYYLQKAEPGSQDSLKLADALRFLNEEYRSVANQMYAVKVIKDPTKTDLLGIQQQEFSHSRQNNLGRMIQGPEGAYIKRAGEILGIKFPLPADPREW